MNHRGWFYNLQGAHGLLGSERERPASAARFAVRRLVRTVDRTAPGRQKLGSARGSLRNPPPPRKGRRLARSAFSRAGFFFWTAALGAALVTKPTGYASVGKGEARAPYEFGVKVSIAATTTARLPDSSCSTLSSCRATCTTATPCATPQGRSASHRHPDRARLPRRGLSWPRRAQSTPRLRLRPKARHVLHHQARAQGPLRHRTPRRPHEGRKSSRPALPQVPRRRRPPTPF